jgi:hypothetical protein
VRKPRERSKRSKTHQKKLKADHILVVDGGLPAANRPAITLGLRGIVAMEVICRNSSIDLHSGIHGGIALNPNRALVEMLSKLWDKKGKIAIPGFYKKVVKPTAKELKALQKIVDENTFASNLASKHSKARAAIHSGNRMPSVRLLRSMAFQEDIQELVLKRSFHRLRLQNSLAVLFQTKTLRKSPSRLPIILKKLHRKV